LQSISPTFYEQLMHPYSFDKKIQSKTVIREKLRKALSYKKVRIKCLWNWHLNGFFFYIFSQKLFTDHDVIKIERKRASYEENLFHQISQSIPIYFINFFKIESFEEEGFRYFVFSRLQIKQLFGDTWLGRKTRCSKMFLFFAHKLN